MARIIPLNRFKSLFASGLKADGLYDLYTAPDQRSATVVLAQCANTTNEARTVTFGVSSTVNDTFYHLVKNFEIPPNDARNLLTGRLILQGFDGDLILSPEILYIKDLTPLTFSETVLVNGFSNFAKIIANPTDIPQTQPGGDVSDTTFLSAANLIERYRSGIQLDTVRYSKSITNALSSDTLSAKCFRDTGYIVDSIVADLRNNANHRCIETGIFYFSGFITQNAYQDTGTTVPSLPLNQVQATISAISAIGAFITGIDIPSNGGFTTVFPDGILSAGSGGESKTSNVIDLVRTVYHPLSTGGDTYSYSPSGEPSLPDKELATSLLQNKPKIQKIVKDYVFNRGYLTDLNLRDKCNRDVGFMVDAVANDLSTGVMAKSIQYALSYWEGAVVGAASRIPSNNPLALNQEKNTIDTVQFLKKTALNVNAPLSGGLSISLGILETKY
jgi:hypothetical protein